MSEQSNCNEQIKTDDSLINHIRNIKLLQAIHSGKRFFVESDDKDEDDIETLRKGRLDISVKEIELPNFDLYEEKLGYKWVKAEPLHNNKEVKEDEPHGQEMLHLADSFFAETKIKTLQRTPESVTMLMLFAEWMIKSKGFTRKGKENEAVEADWKEECERLEKIIKFWRDKYYEVCPPTENPKIDNF